jgi:hypothetical protein
MHKYRYYFTMNGASNAELRCSSCAAKSSFLVDPLRDWRGAEGAYRSSITTTQAHRVRADRSRDADIAQTYQTIGLG